MNIGLISDTHIPEAMPELPVQIRQVFADTEIILHAGDLHCLAVLDWVEEIAPVLAARGNGDRSLAKINYPFTLSGAGCNSTHHGTSPA